MWAGLRNRFWGRVTRALFDADTDTERVLGVVSEVQQLRVWAEELQGVCLHLLALPTRQDVRRLHRRVVSLRERVAELDRALAALEREE
jgi:hypothetical protein